MKPNIVLDLLMKKSTLKMSTLFLMIVLYITPLYAQDTLTVMQYNLLYYGINTEFCTSSNNNITQKEQNFKKIIKHVKPSIITVNEMDASAVIANRFLTNVLNTDGINYYQRADYTNTAGSNTINMLYYDSRKLKYHSQKVLSSYIRDINLYKLYHNSPDLSVTHDTTFIYCIVAHLKAGSTETDLQARKLMTQYAMGNLNTQNIISNIMFMGDLNTKSSSENCFQNLITSSNANIRFYDPINKLGTWNENSNYKWYHTQSTNVSSNNCVSGGGLDDRFDFILINNSMKSNLYKVSYIEDSYQALGQDGLRFNSSIIYPSNTAVPSDIANALYAASDHLPVVLKLLVDRLPAGIETIQDDNFFLSINVSENHIKLDIFSEKSENIYLSVVNPKGQLLYKYLYMLNEGQNQIVVDDFILPKGLFFINVYNNKKFFNKTLKLVNL